MSEKTPRRRKRRSSAELERLEAARRKRSDQLERERENERKVDAALEPFAEAAENITAVRRKRDDRLATLDEQLAGKLATLDRQKAAKAVEYDTLKDTVRAAADGEIAHWRAVMARSVREIRGADVTASDTAEILRISVREVTALTRAEDPRQSSETDDPSSGAGGVRRERDDEAAPIEAMTDDVERDDRSARWGTRTTSGTSDGEVAEPRSTRRAWDAESATAEAPGNGGGGPTPGPTGQ